MINIKEILLQALKKLINVKKMNKKSILLNGFIIWLIVSLFNFGINKLFGFSFEKLLDNFSPKPKIRVSIEAIKYVTKFPDYWQELHLISLPVCNNLEQRSEDLSFFRTIKSTYKDYISEVSSPSLLQCLNCTEYIVRIRNVGDAVAESVITRFYLSGKILNYFGKSSEIELKEDIIGTNEGNSFQISTSKVLPNKEGFRLGFIAENFEYLEPSECWVNDEQKCDIDFYERYILLAPIPSNPEDRNIKINAVSKKPPEYGIVVNIPKVSGESKFLIYNGSEWVEGKLIRISKCANLMNIKVPLANN